MGKDWPWLVGIALLVGVALSVAAYALGSGSTTVTLLSVALLAMALAQLGLLMRGHLQSVALARVNETQTDLAQATMGLAAENRRINVENQNLARNFEVLRTETTNLNAGLVEGISALRAGHESLVGNLKDILDSQKDIQEQLRNPPPVAVNRAAMEEAIHREQNWMSHVTGDANAAHEEPAGQDFQSWGAAPEAAPAPVAFEDTEMGEALTLALEPVVDLFTSKTAHYRMVLGMTNPQGHDVAQDVFLHHADRMGVRASLDDHVVSQALALLEQLRQRDQTLCIFVPLGAQTLGNAEAVQSIIAHVAATAPVSQGLVVDVGHAVLASLPETALEGLATLARAGVVLSLSQASIAGLDLPALNRLNVRFLSLAASSVGVGGQLSAGLPGLVQSARALRIQVIISQLGDPRHVPGLARTARYASGPAFALPRRLKRNPPVSRQTAEAA